MNYILYTSLIVIATCIHVQAQTTVNDILSQIEKNNKNLTVSRTQIEAKRLEFKTGLTPYDPKIEYDYLVGSPSNIGSQREFSIVQSLDFPSVYANRGRLSDSRIAQTKFEHGALRQSILLEASHVIIELIYHHKLGDLLNDRRQNSQTLLDALQLKLDTGEGNLIDLNKAKLQHMEDNSAYAENNSALSQLKYELAELNGGIPIPFADFMYTADFSVPEVETLLSEQRALDPIRNYFQSETVIGHSEVALAKSLSLPKLEIGYLHHSMPGQRFNGLRLGLSIPVWENRNAVQSKRAALAVDESNILMYENKNYHELVRQHERMTTLSATLEDYRELFASSNNLQLLSTSLSLGQISIINYMVELNFFYNSQINYLRTEMEHQKVVAELLKHKL